MTELSSSDPRLPSRILIIKLWALGDIVMATPMLNAIRAKSPSAYICWLVDSSNAEILAAHPLIDEIIPFDTGAWRRLRRKGHLLSWIKMTASFRRQLRCKNFDAVINGQAEDWWSVFFCVAPHRIGLSWFSAPIWAQYYSKVVVKKRLAGLHNTDHFLQGVEALGYPAADNRTTIAKTAVEEPYLAELERRYALSKYCRIVVLAPFSTADNRSIPADYIAQIVDWLDREYRAAIVLVTDGRHSQKVDAVLALTKEANVIHLDGTTLREYIALLRRADIVVTCDSSPMHIAAAVGTPFVALFGPTPTQERLPLAGAGRALWKDIACSPCDLPTCANKVFQECMRKIELKEVESAIGEILAAGDIGAECKVRKPEW